VRLQVVGERVDGVMGALFVALSAAAEQWAEELAEWLGVWSS
jgi:hypothetical protein